MKTQVAETVVANLGWLKRRGVNFVFGLLFLTIKVPQVSEAVRSCEALITKFNNGGAVRTPLRSSTPTSYAYVAKTISRLVIFSLHAFFLARPLAPFDLARQIATAAANNNGHNERLYGKALASIATAVDSFPTPLGSLRC